MNSRKIIIILLLPFIFTSSLLAQTSEALKIDASTIGSNPSAGHYINTRGFNMYYEIYGNGTPLLIIHGNGRSIADFKFQVPYFAQNYKVILADSRAQGKSTDLSDSLSYEMMSDDLNALLDSLHTDSCYVIGWSDGGINGLLLSIRHPDKVKKLAITGANLWPDTTAVDPYVYHMVMKINDQLDAATQTPKIKQERKLAHLLSYEPHIPISDLHKIKCPTLVIGGDHDVILPQHTMLIAASIPESYLWILPNSGHSTPIYYKDEFNAKVADFFKKPYRKIDGPARFR